jgi:hypothetical protein
MGKGGSVVIFDGWSKGGCGGSGVWEEEGSGPAGWERQRGVFKTLMGQSDPVGVASGERATLLLFLVKEERERVRELRDMGEGK